MFNNLDNILFIKISQMLFKYHNLTITSIKQLNTLYNYQYTPNSIKNDILDIYLNDAYTSHRYLKRWLQ